MFDSCCPKCGGQAVAFCSIHGEFACKDGHFWFFQDGRRKEGMQVGHHDFKACAESGSKDETVFERFLLRDRDSIYQAALARSKQITGIDP